jgi:hypothetical protein
MVSSGCAVMAHEDAVQLVMETVDFAVRAMAGGIFAPIVAPVSSRQMRT